MSQQAGESMTGAQSLVRSLEAAGTEHIFGIPGGAILPAYDPLLDSSIRHILVRHEQGAGHAAQGYAAATGRVGRLHGHLRSRAPPTWSPRSPTPTWTRCRSSPSPARSAPPRSAPTPSRRPTSAASRCRSPSTTSWSPTPPRSRATIAEAFHIASTGRPGPVLVDIAKSALQAQTTFAWPTELNLPGYRPVTRPHAKQIREAARLILESRRGRCSTSAAAPSGRGASRELLELAEL